MPTVIDTALDWRTLTATVNEIKSPNAFLKHLLFGDEQTVPTETIEVGLLTGDRSMAPFIKKNTAAIQVAGIGETFQTIEAPNIKIARPLDAANTMFKRRVGTDLFQQSTPADAIQQYVARQLKRLDDLVTNTEEYMCAQVLTGTLTYQVDDLEAFTIVYPKPAGNTVTPSIFWDQANSEVEKNFLTVKKILSEEVGLHPTDCVMSESAGMAFVSNPVVKDMLDRRSISAGEMNLQSQYSDDGAILIGRIFGVNCWVYPRVTIVNGVSTALIRDKYVEFVCATPAAQNIMYFAAIPDWKLFADNGGSIQVKRFSKTWITDDPSVMNLLLHTRPLPVTRRPGSTVSFKAVSG